MDEMLPDFGELELEIMQHVWTAGEVTAEQVREKLTRNWCAPLQVDKVRLLF